MPAASPTSNRDFIGRRRRQPARRPHRRLSRQCEPAAHRGGGRDRRRLATRRARLRGAGPRAVGFRRRPARPCPAMPRSRASCCSSRNGSSASPPSSTSGGAASPNSSSSSRPWRRSCCCRSSRASAIGIILSLLHGAWTTTRAPDGRIRAHSRHHDLVAEDFRAAGRRDDPGRAGDRAAGAAVLPQRL